MKKLLCLLLVLAMCLSVFACTEAPAGQGAADTAPAVSADEKIKLTMWVCDGSPLYTDPYIKFADEYMALHDNVEIEVVGLPYDTNVEKTDTAIATHTAPDLAYYECNHLQYYIDEGALVDLAPYFDNWDKKDQFDLGRLDFPGYIQDGGRYYIPIEFAAAMMLYRKDLMEAHGVAIPQTWDDFFKAAEAMTLPDEGIYGYSFYLRNGASRLESYLLAYTGATSYFDENGKCFVRDPKALEGLERLAAMYLVNSAEDLSNGNSQACSALVSGVAAMSFVNAANYPWMKEDAPADSIVGYTAPLAENGNRVLSIGINQGGGGISIFKDSKNPDAAWDFMAYMLEAKQNSYWNEMTGAFPINKDAYNDQWIKEMQPLDELAKAFGEDNTYVVASPFYLSDYNDIFSKLNSGWQEVVLKTKAPADFLNEWADMMETSYSALQAK